MLIPLDLAVTILFAKMFYVVVIQMDRTMYDVEKSAADDRLVGCDVKNMTMLEDLSRINHIFCDKTGTLTKNELVFKGLAMGDKKFDYDDNFLVNLKAYEHDMDFWRCLTICHECIQFRMNEKDRI